MPVLAAAPTVVAEAFYEVRFGRVPLDSAGAEAVEQALERLGSLASARA
jgi:hypothetical protein